MSLMAGTRLGPYEITGSLGAGGMGEVYRARDTRLNRDVAVKVLPELFLSDPERLARFEREAQLLASLNHPHIAQIYGVEVQSPSTGSGQAVHALVMELVDGDDLTQRSARGPVPVEEALPIARQIADALEAAHERGIIHRDLKPANIKVRDDGVVKVLDFGLAKALDAPCAASVGRDFSPAVLNSPTVTSPATQLGVILGTAAYMAPEQAKGKAVDKRADIWAFGCGSFEFSADGRNLVFADLDERTTIWSAAFDPVQGVLTSQPRQALHGCAIQSIDLSPDGQTIVFSQRQQPWEALGVVRVDGTGWSRLTDGKDFHRLPTWSPDGGRFLFYMSRGKRLWTLRADGSALTEIAIPSEEPAAYPVWSPDGTRVAAALETSVAVYDLSTGSPREVHRFTDQGDMRPFSWSPDGRWIAGSNKVASRDRLRVFDLQTKTHRIVAQDASSPEWLPDSRHLIFNRSTHVVLLDTVTGRERPIMQIDRPFDQWGRTVTLSRDGRTLAYLQFQTEGDVWLMTLEGARK